MEKTVLEDKRSIWRTNKPMNLHINRLKNQLLLLQRVLEQAIDDWFRTVFSCVLFTPLSPWVAFISWSQTWLKCTCQLCCFPKASLRLRWLPELSHVTVFSAKHAWHKGRGGTDLLNDAQTQGGTSKYWTNRERGREKRSRAVRLKRQIILPDNQLGHWF